MSKDQIYNDIDNYADDDGDDDDPDVGGFKLLPRPTSSSRQYHRQGSPLLTAS